MLPFLISSINHFNQTNTISPEPNPNQSTYAAIAGIVTAAMTFTEVYSRIQSARASRRAQEQQVAAEAEKLALFTATFIRIEANKKEINDTAQDNAKGKNYFQLFFLEQKRKKEVKAYLLEEIKQAPTEELKEEIQREYAEELKQ